MKPDLPDLLSPAEVAHRYGVTVIRVNRAITAGELRAHAVLTRSSDGSAGLHRWAIKPQDAAAWAARLT